jgi:hypothetical protein
MKVFAISKDGNFYKIGVDQKSSEWYGKTPAVEQFLSGINKGDEVNIKSEKKNGRNILNYISKTGEAVSPEKVTVHQDKPPFIPYGGKTPEQSEQIKRLSILGSACNAVKALTGQIDQEGLINFVEKFYDKFYGKISS